jgi:hypothetical protein
MTGQGYTPIIPSLRRLRQEECKIKASMSYIARCCPRKLNKCHYSSDSQAPGLFYATRAGLSTIFYKLQDFFSPIINGSHCCLWSSWLETETPVLAIIIIIIINKWKPSRNWISFIHGELYIPRTRNFSLV